MAPGSSGLPGMSTPVPGSSGMNGSVPGASGMNDSVPGSSGMNVSAPGSSISGQDQTEFPENLYRVQVGLYRIRQNADNMLYELQERATLLLF